MNIMSSLFEASDSMRRSGSMDWAFIGEAGFIACIARRSTRRSLSSSSSASVVVVGATKVRN